MLYPEFSGEKSGPDGAPVEHLTENGTELRTGVEESSGLYGAPDVVLAVFEGEFIK